MKKFMIMALCLILVSAVLTGCGCSATIDTPTTPSTTAPTAAPSTVPTTAPTTAPTTPATTMPTTPSSRPTEPSTEDTMPGIIDGTSGQDGTIGTEGENNNATGNAEDPMRSRGMRRR